MTIEQGYEALEQYFAPINKEMKSKFLGIKDNIDETVYYEEEFEEPVFESFDTEDYGDEEW